MVDGYLSTLLISTFFLAGGLCFILIGVPSFLFKLFKPNK